MNAYNPSREDFIQWIKSNDIWPTQDWDLFVTDTGKLDDLIFQFANDMSCKKRDFCIHCLYFIVGEYMNDDERTEKDYERILCLLNNTDNRCSGEVQEWKNKTLDLLNGAMEFDTEFWFNYMFYSAILKLRKKENK